MTGCFDKARSTTKIRDSISLRALKWKFGFLYCINFKFQFCDDALPHRKNKLLFIFLQKLTFEDYNFFGVQRKFWSIFSTFYLMRSISKKKYEI